MEMVQSDQMEQQLQLLNLKTLQMTQHQLTVHIPYKMDHRQRDYCLRSNRYTHTNQTTT